VRTSDAATIGDSTKLEISFLDVAIIDDVLHKLGGLDGRRGRQKYFFRVEAIGFFSRTVVAVALHSISNVAKS
jgi:hypothetical protein